jgi:hypothetical protein
MEEILDIIFKAYSNSIISLEDFTEMLFHITEGKKAESLKTVLSILIYSVFK